MGSDLRASSYPSETPALTDTLYGNQGGDFVQFPVDDMIGVLSQLAITPETSNFIVDSTMAGTMIQVDSAIGVTVTLPADLPLGFSCAVEQSGTGVVSFSAGSGATMVSRLSATVTAGQYAVALIYVRANSDDASAEWLLAGDVA